MNIINTPKTMSSREIAELTGKRHDNVMRTIANCGDLLAPQFEETPNSQNGQLYKVALLNKRDSLVLVARLSPEFTARIVDRWQELEAQQTKPMTQIEVLAGVAQSLLEQERRQLEQAEALAKVESKLIQIEAKADSQVWDECPPNAESITAIRARINERYGIPAWAVNEIVQGDYGPRPAGQVRNKHENASGGTYVVYWRPSITKLFERVYDECEGVTNTMVTHPWVSKRFKLVVL